MGDLGDWTVKSEPTLKNTTGRFIHIDHAQFPDDAEALFAAIGRSGDADLWRYIPFGPFENAEALGAGMAFVAERQHWITYIFRDATTKAVLGMASYMRIRPEAGSVEIGCIIFSKKLQKTPAATEAMYLLARHLFDDLGYRRYEWKCHDGNDASKRAAARLGFSFEGVFRQDMVVKGENRDTAWYSIIDSEWPKVKAAFESWLATENFDKAGQQLRSLQDIRELL